MLSATFIYHCPECGGNTVLTEAGGDLSCDCLAPVITFAASAGKFADGHFHTLNRDGHVD